MIQDYKDKPLLYLDFEISKDNLSIYDDMKSFSCIGKEVIEFTRVYCFVLHEMNKINYCTCCMYTRSSSI